MPDNHSTGFWERTEAFNFIKDLLGVPRKATINKNFFLIFFRESFSGFLIKRTREEIIEIFEEYKLPELNNECYVATQEKNPKAAMLREQIFAKAREGMAKERKVPHERSPYFVGHVGM